MPDTSMPPKKPDSPFASFRGHHVGLRAADYPAVRDWYVEKLDFRVVVEWTALDLNWAYLSPATDDSFHLELMGGSVDQDVTVYGSVFDSLGSAGYLHFCLEVADIDAVVAELGRRDVHIASPTMDNTDIGYRVAFVRDPWGNMIELAQPLTSDVAR